MLGKTITVGTNGLLSHVVCDSDPASPGQKTSALDAPVSFQISVGGKPMQTTVAQQATPKADSHGRSASWKSAWATTAGLSASLTASTDFTGFVDFVVTVNASTTQEAVGVDLILPMAVGNTHFGLGLSRPGGLLSTWFTNRSGCCCDTPRCDTTCTLNLTRKCPQRDAPRGCCPPTASPSETTQWKWDGVNGDNALWLGSSKAGIRVFPKGDEDLWQAGVPFDGRSTPPNPESWSNNGTGGVRP